MNSERDLAIYGLHSKGHCFERVTDQKRGGFVSCAALRTVSELVASILDKAFKGEL
jgi:hypothetical protein